MEKPSALARAQYRWVQESRQVLFSYCGALSADELLNENSSFGRGGSVRNLLVHIANTYEFWIGQQALRQPVAFTAYESQQSMNDIGELFVAVDRLMDEFLGMVEQSGNLLLPYKIGGKAGEAEAFRLFTHVVTHEFHHKGQILSLTRHLGFVPVDTDVMR